ncbi:hypothetical protein DIPPA_11018 [Diplonema papillatum]|nr:hypothetical protein DIPPA_11018 [Diplonema papillatum]
MAGEAQDVLSALAAHVAAAEPGGEPVELVMAEWLLRRAHRAGAVLGDPTSSPCPAGCTASAACEDGGSSISTSTVVAIVIGVAVTALLVVGVTWLFVARRKAAMAPTSTTGQGYTALDPVDDGVRHGSRAKSDDKAWSDNFPKEDPPQRRSSNFFLNPGQRRSTGKSRNGMLGSEALLGEGGDVKMSEVDAFSVSTADVHETAVDAYLQEQQLEAGSMKLPIAQHQTVSSDLPPSPISTPSTPRDRASSICSNNNVHPLRDARKHSIASTANDASPFGHLFNLTGPKNAFSPDFLPLSDPGHVPPTSQPSLGESTKPAHQLPALPAAPPARSRTASQYYTSASPLPPSDQILDFTTNGSPKGYQPVRLGNTGPSLDSTANSTSPTADALLVGQARGRGIAARQQRRSHGALTTLSASGRGLPLKGAF